MFGWVREGLYACVWACLWVCISLTCTLNCVGKNILENVLHMHSCCYIKGWVAQSTAKYCCKIISTEFCLQGWSKSMQIFQTDFTLNFNMGTASGLDSADLWANGESLRFQNGWSCCSFLAVLHNPVLFNISLLMWSINCSTKEELYVRIEKFVDRS